MKMKNKLPTKNSQGRRNKAKGSSYERDIANLLKQLGLSKVKTSRQASRLYDDCKIDHWGAQLPNGQLLLTQCKYGYKANRPKADVEFRKQKEEIEKNFPIGSLELNEENIQVLFHKINDYSPENHLVTIKLKDFTKLLKVYINAI